ncbi:hypothetical protein IVA95_07080 [Bradyrhizobium sp. 157]|nr:hypothetical protein [Bradyrhizobium sp. 157]MCK1637354.1 hypothetical protein [Bradyrhizobium sp. 157]
MKLALIAFCVATMVSPALADPWKDESGKGRWGGGDRNQYRSYNYDRDHKQEFHRGPCKVERK